MKKTYIIIIALLVLTNSCFAAKKEEQKNNYALQSATVQEDTASYTSKASAKFMKKDINGAIEVLTQGIQQNPNDPQLYLNRGFIKHVILDFDGALQDYNNAIKVSPNYAYGYNNRGVLKVSLNDIKGAIEDYEKALSLNPRYADVYYNRGNLKYMLNDNEGALADYDMAIKYNPKDSEAYNNRGVVKKRMNFNVGALSDYSQAIALNPKDSIAYANRGRLKKLYFDNEGASIDLDKAIELAETQVFIKNVKPLLSDKHYIAAIPVAKGITDINGDININQRNSSDIAMQPQSLSKDDAQTQSSKLAMASGMVNNISKEEKNIQQKNTISTVNKKSVQNSSVAEIKSSGATVLNAGIGKVATPVVPDISTSQVTQNATTNIKLAESYYIRGLQKCVLHDMQGALVDLDKAIANNNKYADAYFYRAAIKKELGDKEGFRKDYSTAIQINPSLQTYNDIDALSMVGR